MEAPRGIADIIAIRDGRANFIEVKQVKVGSRPSSMSSGGTTSDAEPCRLGRQRARLRNPPVYRFRHVKGPEGKESEGGDA